MATATYTPPSGTVNVGTASAPVLQNISNSNTTASAPAPKGIVNVTGQNPQVLGANNQPIPGAPKLDAQGNIIPGTGSTNLANNATVAAITNPPATTPVAPLTTPSPGNTTTGATGTTGAIPGLEGGMPLTDSSLSGKYNTALTGLNAGGSTAPVDAGSGSAAASNAISNVPTSQTDNSANVQTALQQDPGYQQLLQDQQEYMNATNQSQTLQSQYQNLENQYNIPQLNSQLINMQNVINGTEDDIRTEVTAANGFATNSQVLALSDARNKTVIQNYNQLQATVTNAQNQVNTMIGLAKDDQANALSAITGKIGIDQQLASYATQFINNAKEGYNTLISTVGISGLYNGLVNSDPTGKTLASAAQVLGMTPAEMATAAKQDAQSKSLDIQSKQMGIASSAESIENSKLDIAQKQQDLLGSEGVPIPGKAGQAGYTDNGVKYNTSNAGNEVIQNWQSSGVFDKNTQVPPSQYNQGLAWWTAQGLSPTDYKTIMAQYVPLTDKKYVKNYSGY